jgi:FixJ family two-component response regulator
VALESGGPWAALIIDLMLPDGNGWEVVRAARKADGAVPILVATGHGRVEFFNLIGQLEVELMTKGPDAESLLKKFASKAADLHRAFKELLAAQVEGWEKRFGITRREADVARTVVCDETPRADLAKELGIAPSTVDTHVANLIHKLGCPSLDAVVVKALREVNKKKGKTSKSPP